MFPRQSSGQTPILNRMGLDQLKVLFDRSMQPGSDTQYDPYAVLSAIRSKTEEAKFAQAQRNMAAMQQNQAQGIGSLAQQVRREADMVQPSVNMEHGGIVAFTNGGSNSPEDIERMRRDNMVTPEVQAQRDQIAAQTRAQTLKTPEAARAKLEQLDRAVAQATESDSKGIFERERRLTTQALRILESQGPIAAIRSGVGALLPAANAAAVPPNPAPSAGDSRSHGVRRDMVPASGTPSHTDPRAQGIRSDMAPAPETASHLDSRAQGIRSDTPILGGNLIVNALSGSKMGEETPAQSRSMELYPGAGTPRAPVEVPESPDMARIRQAVEDARAAVTKAEENLEKFRAGTAGGKLQQQKPAEYQAALAASAAAKDKLRDAQLSLQAAYGPAMGASSTPPPVVTPATQSAQPAPAATPPAAAAAEQVAPSAAPSAAAAEPSAGPTRSIFDTLVAQIAAREESRGRELENRLSELRTRRGVPDEIAAGQAGIERLMAEQIANEQRMRDERMAEARKLYESRQGELKPDIARVLRNLNSRSGALFESLGEGVEKEEQRVRTGKEESRKELTAAQRESEEAGRNILKLRMLEAQRVQAIRQDRQKDVDRIDDQIAELRDKVAGQDIEALKAQADIRLRQAQVEKPSDLQERINLMLRNPGLFYKLYPPADQKVATIDILKQMATNYATLAKEVIDPKQKQIYLDQLTRVNTLLEKFIGEPQMPPDVKAQLREGVVTGFSNGQQWTLQNGQPVRVK